MTIMTTAAGQDDGDDVWTVAGAKSHFSQLIERAHAQGPQFITSRGRHTAVLVSHDEWQRKTQRIGTLADFFAASPLCGAPDLVIERLPNTAEPPPL